MKAIRVLFWPVLAVACAGVAFALLVLTNIVAVPTLFTVREESSDSQIRLAVSRQEEVALLALAVQGIARKDTQGELLGVAVPASSRTTLLQYEFTAKVGIDAENVALEANGDGGYVVRVPQFVFVGYDKPRFEDPIENNGAISWLSPEIEETEMVNAVLSEDNQQDYIELHLDELRSQAESFYTGIITSVDSSARVTFEFAQ